MGLSSGSGLSTRYCLGDIAQGGSCSLGILPFGHHSADTCSVIPDQETVGTTIVAEGLIQ
jgi:hypothetical protein